ncbi:MBL fold metallo-hydrolase [Falsibacillus pallidus]|uniref:Glyoxylase-like metal-dependent hydrolase (Beta-lactamase superfamily II) n=1 Tax=Falsibacillus pallidus TaxID=493781 RepID=A0A370GJH0_9BACI|nr:MBL fold metallo-hydrolase [Falsibacillus pallidus]RDI43942.1 glyoxylase-like metal-dependent hydrolase (beta-lactamase superfamily II) [Falsibacillus pallidus]
MKWSRLPLGPIQTNCYILADDDKKCLIFDPGDEGEVLISWLRKRGLEPEAILLTHAHFDHIGAVDVIREHYKIPVYVHEKEAKWLMDPALNGSQFFNLIDPVRVKPADQFIAKEGELSIGKFSLEVLETPGHSPGSVSYYLREDGIIFSGDVLFQQSIGRTDLPGGDQKILLKTIHDKLLVLPENTLVLSGHGPETLIEDEMDSNPFLNGF